MKVGAGNELQFCFILASHSLESEPGKISIGCQLKIFVHEVAKPSDFAHVFFMDAFSINKLMAVFAFLAGGLV